MPLKKKKKKKKKNQHEAIPFLVQDLYQLASKLTKKN